MLDNIEPPTELATGCRGVPRAGKKADRKDFRHLAQQAAKPLVADAMSATLPDPVRSQKNQAKSGYSFRGLWPFG